VIVKKVIGKNIRKYVKSKNKIEIMRKIDDDDDDNNNNNVD
jgi:hypothetical protein